MMRNVVTVLLLSFVATCLAKDLIMGNTYGARLAWRTKVNAMAFPLQKRVKQVFYSNPKQTPIRAIVVRDLDYIMNSVESLTSGGIGLPFVNLRLKSARGKGLNYQIEIYV